MSPVGKLKIKRESVATLCRIYITMMTISFFVFIPLQYLYGRLEQYFIDAFIAMGIGPIAILIYGQDYGYIRDERILSVFMVESIVLGLLIVPYLYIPNGATRFAMIIGVTLWILGTISMMGAGV